MIYQDYSTILSRTKLFYHLGRFGNWFYTGETRPISAQLDTTNDCCFNCVGCAGHRTNPNAMLTRPQISKIVDEIAPVIRGLEITGGGDPLANESTTYAITYAKKKGIDVGLITNGYLLSGDNIPILAAETTFIRVSVDASDDSTHMKRKKTGNERSLSIILKNIEDLTKERNRQGSKTTIGTSYLTDNYDDMESLRKFAELSKSLGVDYVQFKPYHGSDKNFLSELEILSALNSEDFRIIYAPERYEKKKGTYKKAFADEFRTVISATGDMYPDCYTRGIENFSFGNLLTSSFEEIWTSKRRKEVFETKLEQANCPSQCFYDSLSQLLWDINTIDRSNPLLLDHALPPLQRGVMHRNFV